MTSPILLKAEKINRQFGLFPAVKDFDLTLKKGEVVALIGANGAGKTTTMKMLAGVLAPSSGDIRYGKYSLAKERKKCQQLLGYVAEGAPSWPHMTPRQIFAFKTAITATKNREMEERIIASTHIQHVLDTPIQMLSKGYKRRVALAEAFIHNPSVLILDEPTDGLDPKQKQETRKFITESAQTKGILISTHILEEAASICSRVIVFHQGKIHHDIPMQDLPGTGSDLEKLQELFFATALETPAS